MRPPLTGRLQLLLPPLVPELPWLRLLLLHRSNHRCPVQAAAAAVMVVVVEMVAVDLPSVLEVVVVAVVAAQVPQAACVPPGPVCYSLVRTSKAVVGAVCTVVAA